MTVPYSDAEEAAKRERRKAQWHERQKIRPKLGRMLVVPISGMNRAERRGQRHHAGTRSGRQTNG